MASAGSAQAQAKVPLLPLTSSECDWLGLKPLTPSLLGLWCHSSPPVEEVEQCPTLSMTMLCPLLALGTLGLHEPPVP